MEATATASRPAWGADAPGTGAGFAVVDTETTGLDPRRDRVVEIAVVRLDPSGEVVDEWETLVDPGRGPGPTDVHGITGAMLAGSPPFARVWPLVERLLSGRVVVGHNLLGFDLPVLFYEVRRLGWRFPACALQVADTAELARRAPELGLGAGGGSRLAEVCSRFGLEPGPRHSAISDARAAAAVLAHFVRSAGCDRLGLSACLAGAWDVEWPGASLDTTAWAQIARARPQPPSGPARSPELGGILDAP